MKLSRHLRLIVACLALLPSLCSWSTSAFALMGGAVQNGDVALNDAGAASAVLVSTLAASPGVPGAIDAIGAVARFRYPSGITTDGANLYVADTNNQIIRKVVIASGEVSTLAGSVGSAGAIDGTGMAAQFSYPHGITTDGANLYVVDTDSQTIRRVVITTGSVTTLAGGVGLTGSMDGSGAAARFSGPTGITTDGVSLYVTDTNNQTIRKVAIATGIVTTLAGSVGVPGSIDGTGAAAMFFNPYAITTDGSNLYVADTANQIIRQVVIATGAVTTVAGTAGVAGSVDGTGVAAQFNNPQGLTTDGTNLYVANDDHTIRKVVIASGVVSTLAGSGGVEGSVDGLGTLARFKYPHSLTTDGSKLYVTDTWNHTVRAATRAVNGATAGLSVSVLAFGNQNAGSTSMAQTLVLSNPGDALLSINSIAASGHYASTTDCGVTLAPGAHCNISVTFTPSGTGVVGDVLTIDTGAVSKTFLVSLNGTGVIDPAAPVMLDQSLRFDAVPVIDVGGSGSASAMASSGIAVDLGSTTPEVCTVSGNTVTGLVAGLCIISAAQGGNATYNAATPVVQKIIINSTLSLAPSWNFLGNGIDETMAVATTFGDSSKVETVWKWLPDAGRWAFYTPTLSDGGAAFAAQKGYDFLTTVAGGEGFWANSKGLGTVSRPLVQTSCVKTVMALELARSWNLVSNNEVAPMTMADTFDDASKVFAVWKWVPASKRWAFYTPLQADHGAAYAAAKGYDVLTTIERSEGFWVNTSTALTVPLPALPTSCQCDRSAKVDKVGNVIFPPEATETELPVNVDEDLGSIAALYPGLDTTTDAFYPDMPCGDQASIGGTLPTEVPDTQDQIDSENFLSTLEPTTGANILEQLQANPAPAVSLLSGFTMEGCFVTTAGTPTAPGSRKPTPCDSTVFLDSTMPFEGRDIIYVHGLDVNPIKVRIGEPFSNNALLATKVWPQDASEFLNAGGYFRTNAENYWRPHITEHLSTQDPMNLETGWQWGPADGALPVYKPKANRYLIVAWSANQTIEYAQHALLTQIQLAITSNKNVVTPPSYPAQNVRPFCANGCIIIGHSTGPLITSSALGLAHAGFFGPGGKEITRHIVAHISFAGAISGSRIASVAMALVSPLAVGPPPGLCNFMSGAFDVNFCAGDTSFIATGILRDLIPAVAQGVWGLPVEMSPVPTVTFAGGHPTGNQATGRTGWWLPGVDDGVVTMNSACGNPNPVFPYVSPPSGMIVTSLLKAFEFSEWSPRLARGTSMRLAQRNLKMTPPLPGVPTDPFHFYLASACTPTLSASGMVMPVANDLQWSIYDARRRYRNHYSFMQSLAEHSHDGGGSTPNAWPSSTQGPADAPHEYAPYVFPGIPTEYWGVNVEESRAVTDASIYTRMIDSNGTHLAKPLDMREFRRGRKVSFHMPFNLGNCQKQGFLRYYCTAWIWKRTYHLADKWERKQSSHYAYEFVGRR